MRARVSPFSPPGADPKLALIGATLFETDCAPGVSAVLEVRTDIPRVVASVDESLFHLLECEAEVEAADHHPALHRIAAWRAMSLVDQAASMMAVVDACAPSLAVPHVALQLLEGTVWVLDMTQSGEVGDTMFSPVRDKVARVLGALLFSVREWTEAVCVAWCTAAEGVVRCYDAAPKFLGMNSIRHLAWMMRQHVNSDKLQVRGVRILARLMQRYREEDETQQVEEVARDLLTRRVKSSFAVVLGCGLFEEVAKYWPSSSPVTTVMIRWLPVFARAVEAHPGDAAVATAAQEVLQTMVSAGRGLVMKRFAVRCPSDSIRQLLDMVRVPATAAVLTTAASYLLTLVASSKDNCEVVVDLGGVTAVLDCMDRTRSTEVVQANLCHVLRKLLESRHANVGAVTEMLEAGIVPCVFAAMDAHPSAPGIHGPVCALLLELTRIDSAIVATDGCGLLRRLLATVTTPGMGRGPVRDAAAAVNNLGIDDRLQAHHDLGDPFPSLHTTLLTLLSGSSDLVLYVCETVAALVECTPQFQVMCAAADGVQALLAVAGATTPADVALRASVCRALGGLASNDALRPAVVGPSVVGLIRQFLTENLDHESKDVVLHAVRAVAFAAPCVHPKAGTLLRLCVRAMSTLSGSANIQTNGCCAVAALLVALPGIEGLWWELGGCKVLCNAMRAFPAVETLQVKACGVLSMVSSSPTRPLEAFEANELLRAAMGTHKGCPAIQRYATQALLSHTTQTQRT